MSGIVAVSLSGTRALVGEYQGPDIAVVDVTGAPTLVGSTMNSAFSGVSSVAANGVLGIVGQQFGPGVRAVTGINGAPALGGSKNTTMAGVSSVALTSFSPPRIVLPSTSIAFGNVLVGASKPLQLTVQNTGGSALNLSSITSSSPRFTAATTFSVAANSTGLLTVTCTPTVAGPLTANLTANTNDPLTTSITVSLTCTGTLPPPTVVVPATLPFNVVRVGTTLQKGLSVQNVGGQPLQLTNILSTAAQFVPTVSTLTVNAGLTGSVPIDFSPTAEISYNGALTANTNDPMKPTISVALSGTGGLPHIQAPTSLSLGNAAVGCQPAMQTLTVSNTGAAQLNVTSITLPSGPFTRSPASLVVPGNGNAPVQVTFTPTAIGPASATMTLVNDDPDLAKQNFAVSLTGTGTAPPPPVIAATPSSLNFGSALVNFFFGKRVDIKNNGTCSTLTVNLTSSSAVFPVTSDPNPTTTPPWVAASGSVAPGATQSFVVVFAPTATGAATGTLTIASNDPANPTVTIPLSGNGVLASSTSSVSMILDRSGSMSDVVSVGGTKMDALKAAGKLFTDLIISGQGDRLGTVEFDDLYSVLTTIAAVDASQKTAVATGIDGLFPRGATSIGGGLQTGLAQLSGSTTPRQVMMVFTDGMENTPPMIATVKPTIPSTTEVYAVGFGDPSQISAAALTDLAISSSGRYFNPQDPLLLRKDFVQVLSDAFRSSMAFDPIYTLNAGSTKDVYVPLSTCDRRVSFIEYWEKPASQVDVEVVAPNGMVYTPTAPLTNRLVRYVAQPNYRFYQIAFPPIDGPAGAVIGPPRAGTWIVRLGGNKIAGGSERVSVSVVVESSFMLKAAIDNPRIGRPLTFTVRLTESDKPVLGALVTARVRSPQRNIGQMLIELAPTLRAAVARRRSGADTILDRAFLIRQLLARPGFEGRPITPTRVAQYQLFDDGKHGDGAASDGVYGLVLSSLAVEGGYTIEYTAQAGICQGTPLREGTLSFYAALRPDSARTTINVTPGTIAGTVTVTVTPLAANGVPLGPGLAPTIQASVASGQGRVGAVRDNLNGSYTIDINDVRPGAILRLNVGGASITVPVRRTAPAGKS
jgi:hypothetical protein